MDRSYWKQTLYDIVTKVLNCGCSWQLQVDACRLTITKKDATVMVYIEYKKGTSPSHHPPIFKD